MAKKVSDSQIAGIKAHAEAKNKATIDKVNKAIDKLKKGDSFFIPAGFGKYEICGKCEIIVTNI